MPKGVYIKTEKHRKNLSLALKGKKLSEETRRKISLARRGFGRKQSEETKRKIGLAHKGMKHTEESKIKCGLANKGKIISESTRKKLSLARQSEKHPNWKGDEASYSALHHWVARYLGKPATCEFCGKTGLTGKHINWANKSHEYKRDLTDWLRLCAPCHSKYDGQKKNK